MSGRPSRLSQDARRRLADAACQLGLDLERASHERKPPAAALVAIDEAPIRAEHASKAHRLLARYSSQRKKLAEHDDLDKPAFGRWLASRFGEELALSERLAQKLVRVRDLAMRIETERAENRLSYRSAFEAVMHEDSSGLRAQAEEAADASDCRSDDPEDRDDFDDDPYSGDDSESQESSERYTTFNNSAFDWTFGGEKGENVFGQSASKRLSIADLIKDRYRKLVRLLHPDIRPGDDPWAKELWHETQGALREKDPLALDALLSLARLRFGKGADTPLIGEAISAAGWLKAALAEMAIEMRLAKRSDSWGFTKLKDRTRLERKLAYQIEDDLSEMQIEIARYDAFIERCASAPPPRARPKPKKKSQTQPRRPNAARGRPAERDL